MIFRYGSKYGSKDIIVKQYNTKQEKDILIMLMQNINHVHFNILDEALKIIDYSDELIASLTDNEKRIVLLKCRELSVGDDICFNFSCNKCKKINMATARVDDFFTNRIDADHKILELDDFKIVELYGDVQCELNNYIVDKHGNNINDDDLDELDSVVYEDLFDEIKNHTIKFTTEIVGYCSCGNNVKINLSDRFVVENMSEDTIHSMYKTYSDLIYYGNYSKQDIDSLIPFERTIFVGMLNATKKETTAQ